MVLVFVDYDDVVVFVFGQYGIVYDFESNCFFYDWEGQGDVVKFFWWDLFEIWFDYGVGVDVVYDWCEVEFEIFYDWNDF